MRFKNLSFALFLILSCIQVVAQDVHFSQFQQTGLMLNPAVAGLNSRVNSTLAYRSQWSALTNPYQTYLVFADFAMTENGDKNYWGIGTHIYHDVAGEGKLGTLQANVNVAYHIKVADKSFFSAGFTGGLIQKRANTSYLKWESQYVNYIFDSDNPSGEILPEKNNFLRPDLGIGLNWKYIKGEEYMTANDFVKWDVGFSMQHIITPNYSFYAESTSLKKKYSFYALFIKGVRNHRICIEPLLLYSIQGRAMELVAGSGVRYKLKVESQYTGFVKSNSIAFNALYRYNDALILQVMADWGNYVLGLGYDINISRLTQATNARGATEITIKYAIPFQKAIQEDNLPTIPVN